MREYFSPKQFAEILGVQPDRVRQWQKRGLIAPAFTKGPVEYRRSDLVRMAMLAALAEVFEQPMSFIDAHGDELHVMAAQLEAGAPAGFNDEPIRLTTPSCEVALKPAIVAALRERLAQVSA